MFELSTKQERIYYWLRTAAFIGYDTFIFNPTLSKEEVKKKIEIIIKEMATKFIEGEEKFTRKENE